MQIKEKAYAKLNISLDVGARREDGYHDMVMVMQSISLYDEVLIRLNNSGRISANSNLRFIPNDERNLAVRAAMRYLDTIGEEQGLSIDIKKNVPVGSGMGGGSSDAAAVLRALNHLYGNRLGRAELETLASGIGADVAFCVAGGTMLAEGKGELLSPLPEMPECSFVICKPEFSISTPELFKKLDSAPIRCHPDTAGLLQALGQGELNEICRRMYNVFEDVDDRRMRTIAEIKGKLLDKGALGAIMTGTGSAVFGVFEDAQCAQSAAQQLRAEYRFCYTAKPVKRILP